VGPWKTTRLPAHLEQSPDERLDAKAVVRDDGLGLLVIVLSERECASRSDARYHANAAAGIASLFGQLFRRAEASMPGVS
jgi:hypothetical protein